MHALIIWVLSLTYLAIPILVQSAPVTQSVQKDVHQHGFVYCINGIFHTFNPQMSSGGLAVDTLATQLYDRLLAIDPYTYQLVPELAEKWQMLDNGTTYRFQLRKEVAFQTTAWFTPSRMMNADDVIFSFQRILNREQHYHHVNGSKYPYFDSLQFAKTVRSIKKLDDYRVEFHLKAPDASFLSHLATHYAPILSAEYADKLTKKNKQQQIDQEPIGTGPFMLNEYRSGQYIRLFRHNQYWRGLPRMQQVVIDLGVSGTGRLSKLLTGECDVLAYPAANQLTILRNDPRLRLTLRPGMNLAYLSFNTLKPPLNNVNIRHAIALAINRQRLMQAIYYGTAEAATSILPRASWAYDSQAQITQYNPNQARKILQQLGIKQLELSLWVPTATRSYNPSPLKTAELIQADLAQIGITVNIIPVEGHFHERHQKMEMSHDLILSGWATDSNDPDSFFRPILSCAAINSQANYSHWCDPQFDTLLQDALQTQQRAERIHYYQQAQHILEQQLPVLPLASSLRLQAYRHDIKGLILSTFGSASFAGVFRDSDESKKP
ncbi:ABC transporter substrate-binding protein SapA [Candidatus Fukatsuia symbiotica]|uniref:Peptide ABC transporter substrate-binding protein SapA n=1 Tax=Candidatus Fukatsuia symbiotica TaxID=1878942 RepID=A0A2U8I8J7_9GAMM|nr:ABC transporter substrate-binding protein SapA [Candidatus Fukatsuia symbiotica]AWK14375.1 peptide ABC transporter substrate-binding protein SapA [Candidatus Fukatsuia symbiotica]MEA9444641.1 ABC transporter substrate-binding protein SapA [Candidatus Fukatsuia symbiotica]